MRMNDLEHKWAHAWAQLKDLQRAGWELTLTPTFTPFGVITSVIAWTCRTNPYFAVYHPEWQTQTTVPITGPVALIDPDALPNAIAEMHAKIFPISNIGDIPAREL